MSSLVADVRVACRQLLARPMFTAVAILTLAIGIGVNTVAFTVVNGVLRGAAEHADPQLGRIVTTPSLLLPGLRAGLVLAFAGARASQAVFVGMDALNPATYAAAAVQCLVVLTACVVPALRAGRVDPVEALRA